jgi:hypothetical protein
MLSGATLIPTAQIPMLACGDHRSHTCFVSLIAMGNSRFQWVMNLEAFQAKMKSLWVSAFQPLTASSVGVR